MVNPDNTKINYVPSDDTDATTDNQQIAPAKPSDQASKDFQRVLSKGKEHKGDPKTKKKILAGPFSSKLQKADDDEEEEILGVEEKATKDDEENASDGAAVSLFDLSKSHAQPKEKVASAPQPKSPTPVKGIANAESPNELFKRMSAKNPTKEYKPVAKGEQPPEHFTTRYTQEQPDLAYVNPFANNPQAPMAAVPVTPSDAIQRPAPVDENMQLLIQQVIKQMYTVSQEGQTDTVMTVQYPPLFENATITVTAFDTARGQFNISIENLTQAAQRLLDLDQNRNSLISALHEKGYNVVQFQTTTVQTETRITPPESNQKSREDQEKDREEQQNRKRR
jgi:hypothetical protein